MHKDLNHLNQSEIEELIVKYYETKNEDDIKYLLNTYNLDIPWNLLHYYFPRKMIESEKCEYCQHNLVFPYISQKENNFEPINYKLMYDEKHKYICPSCSHKPYDENCNCIHCYTKKETLRIKKIKQAKQEEEQRKKQLIFEQYGFKEPINYESLTLAQKVKLGTIVKSCMTENLYEFIPISNYKGKLTPNTNYTDNIIQELYRINAIEVSPFSPINAFVDNENFPQRFYIYKVIYYLNIEQRETKQKTYNQITIESFDKLNYASNEVIELWKEICIEECLEYLQYKFNNIEFPFEIGEKTRTTFEQLLYNFSVSQIFGIIKRCIDSASTYYLENNISKKHAANIVISNISKYAERALANEWTLYEYSRLKDLPQSDISSFFFNTVLKIGDAGFKMSLKDFCIHRINELDSLYPSNENTDEIIEAEILN